MNTTDLDWLIVGGGVHGVHLAARLIAEADVDPSRLRIVDPAERLLHCWRMRTSRTGMRFLRSPSVHHLGIGPWALERFAGKRKVRKRGLFAAPYSRPSLELFNAHCDEVVAEFRLHELHVRELATECRPAADSVLTTLCSGATLTSERIVLALGVDELTWPDWAPRRSPRVGHIFAPRFETADSATRFAVVGGGITATQFALRLASEGKAVHLISRHAPRQHQFDSDPGWLGPKRMAGFQCVTDFCERRKMISSARHRGSVPPDVMKNLRRARSRDELTWHESEVKELCSARGGISLHLEDEVEIIVDQVVLATGSPQRRPGGRLVDRMVDDYDLPTGTCGFPIVDRHLRWHPRVHVAGALAELELGPTARNIAGARRAASRLVSRLALESSGSCQIRSSKDVRRSDRASAAAGS